MAELAFLLAAYPNLLDGTQNTFLAKPVFWAMGYGAVMPLTLWWAYRYYARYVDEGGDEAKGCETVECAIDFSIAIATTKSIEYDETEREREEDEALPPMERKTTPFLMDSSRTMGSHTSKDGWDRFSFD